MSKTFNYYCDESCHLLNDGQKYMVIGYTCSAYNQVQLHQEAIKELKNRHKFNAEIKWNKVSHSKYPFYNDLIEYFFASDLQFRAIIVKKTDIDNAQFGQSHDDFYYKMYYQLINHKIDMESSYNVYLDIKDTLSANKVRKLKDLLNIRLSVIRNLQNIRSEESLLLQLADLLIGAIAYHLRGDGKVIAKNKLIEKIKLTTNHNLQRSTPFKQSKFNLFFIDLKK
jgi:Protein of unknown function (DUF3800)